MSILMFARYRPEQNFSPRVLMVLILFLDILGMFGLEITSADRLPSNELLILYLVVFGFAGVGILVDVLSRHAARWYTFLGLTLILYLASLLLRRPEILILEFLPICLLASISDLPSALGATGLTSAALLVLRFGVHPSLDAAVFGIALFACFASLAVLFSIYLPINRLSIWMNEHYKVSERMLAEAREQKAELEQALNGLASANRQLALANKKMAELSKIAEDAQKAKAMFVVNVSHEFRTPLNMIIGLIDLMTHHPENYDMILSPKMREDFAVISRNCEHLTNMVSDVLDLTRVETGRLVLYREWVDLREIVEKGVMVVRPLLDKKHLFLSLEIPPDLPNVYCDRVRVQQVILNLLSNAARFTETGGITLITTYDDRQVSVRVTDTGPGISMQDRERIFEPFWQGKAPLFQKKGGSGIGLSLSKEFVTLHGGHIWFESSQNQGTSFFFTLPISPLSAPQVKPGHLIKSDWVWRENDFQAAKISAVPALVKPRIVIYDETDTLYSRFLHYTDKVEFVNLQDFHQLSRESLAKAFIINAPSFEKLWPMVQAASQSPSPTPVIGCSIPGEFRRALETGATGYLIKPIKLEDFRRILNSGSRPVRDILLVDDDCEVLNLYARMLQTCDPDLAVRRLSNGEQAIQEVVQRPPDLMFLDVVMPDMTGWQILEEIGRLVPERSFPIYFITAQDPVDQLVSNYMLATLKGGIPLGKLINTSLEIASLFMDSEPGRDREPGQTPADEPVL